MVPRAALRICAVLVLTGTGAVPPLLAQEAEPTPPTPAAEAEPAAKPAPTAKPGREKTPKPAAAQPKAAPAPARRGQLANVRVDVRITDVGEGRPPMTKSVSLTVGDRQQGMVRSTVDIGSRRLPLNVDVVPEIEGHKIRLRLTLDYNIVSGTDLKPDDFKASTEVREHLGLVLESGKSLVVSESADPLSDRRVKLEVTATILP